ncbi:general stress protein [Brachybacterium halotolerans]|uniref:general stress protein n=1 Tax=Brachybacterium halotolerans TaxID=2795215 RepID=UPI001FE952D3|nr:general stress protein [Brachybacterium halotolerans]
MTQPQQQPSPLTARLYKLEYPRSLGTYSTYAEVQAVVDALADAEFPVENTMIVGTDLKLMERVTGRRTWGKVLLNGALSGVWMGLFIGLLLALFSGHLVQTVISGVLFGVVFFTIWSAISYAATGGNRDFTSMTATIPMQYELMVEHSHAQAARSILLEAGATPPGPAAPQTTGRGANGAPVVPAAAGTQQPARPPHGEYGAQSAAGAHGGTGPQQARGTAAPSAAYTGQGSWTDHAASAPADASGAPSPSAENRPEYGRPAAPAPTRSASAASPSRPQYGRPASAPTADPEQTDEDDAGAPTQDPRP